MGRPTHVDRQKALDSVLMLFWKQGYQATKLPELLEVTELSRGTFYRAFGDKREAYIEALKHYGDTRLLPALAMLNDRNDGEIELRLQRFFERTEPITPYKPVPKIGCFVCNAMIEVAPFDETVADECQRLSDVLEAELLTALTELPVFDDPTKAELNAKLLARIYFGSHASARIGQSFGSWSTFFEGFLR